MKNYLLLLILTGCGMGGGEAGFHRGYITDVSLSGWFCKTYEAQVMTGSGNSAIHYNFTINDKNVYVKLKEAQEKQLEVNLEYHSPRVYSLCSSSYSNFVDNVTFLTGDKK